MGKRLHILWQRGWAWFAVALGGLLSTSSEAGRSARAAHDAVVLSVQGGLVRVLPDPGAERREGWGAPRPDPLVEQKLAASGRPILPPESWNLGGRFETVLLGSKRSLDRLPVLGENTPVGMPAVVTGPQGVSLIGFTVAEGSGVAVRPITARRVAISARAGAESPVQFRATGDGGPLLRVDGPDARTRLQSGDQVLVDPTWDSTGWGTEWSPPAGFPLRLGQVEVDADSPDWRRAQTVRPDHDVRSLRQVAVFVPAAGGRSSRRGYSPLSARFLASPADSRRDAGLLAVGWQQGVRPGQPVVDGHWLLGRVESVGWSTCRVQGTWDPGARFGVMVLGEGVAVPSVLMVESRGESRLLDPPPSQAVVATGFGDPAVPDGLRVAEFEGDQRTDTRRSWPERAWVLLPSDAAPSSAEGGAAVGETPKGTP